MRWKFWQKRQPLPAVRTISEAELDGIFQQAPDSRLFAGVAAVVDLEVQESLNHTLDESLSNDQMRSRLGAVAGMLQIKAALQERQQEAERRVREQLKAAREDNKQ